MPTNADRLLLLADHIKLSLLERNRAISLKLEPNTADAYISRSLETLRQGIDQIEQEQTRMEEHGEVSAKVLKEQEDLLVDLRSQYDELTSQFIPAPAPKSSSTIDLPISSKAVDPNTLPYTDEPPTGNSPPSHYASSRGLAAYVDDVDESPSTRPLGRQKPLPAQPGAADLSASLRKSKQVRFSDNLVDAEELDNQQVLQLHERIMEEQDETLDRLSHSISRQRELSIQIGDELDSQGEILDDLDDSVDRTHRRIKSARKRLDSVARTAKDNGSLITIAVLIIVLVLLIALLK